MQLVGIPLDINVLKNDQSKSNFLCLCPQCQYNIEGIIFTVDSLINQINHRMQIMYLLFALLIFIVGGITNYASIVTVQRPPLRKSSMGIYILIISIISQYSLLSLLIKIVFILFDSMMTNISYKIISYMHSVSIRYLFWLTINVQRLFAVKL